VEAPLLDMVHAVLFGGVAPRDGLMQLLARDPKREHEPTT
jgi:glycerol-3-phosphate dehydrogenase